MGSEYRIPAIVAGTAPRELPSPAIQFKAPFTRDRLLQVRDAMLANISTYKQWPRDSQVQGLSNLHSRIVRRYSPPEPGMEVVRDQFLARHALFGSLPTEDQLTYLYHLANWRGKDFSFWAWTVPYVAKWVRTMRSEGLYDENRDGNWFVWWIQRGQKQLDEVDRPISKESELLGHLAEYEVVLDRASPRRLEWSEDSMKLPSISEILQLDSRDGGKSHSGRE